MSASRMKGGVWKVGNCWMVQYRHGGKTIRESARCRTRGEAVAYRESKRTQSRQGTLVPDARRVTYDDLKAMFEARAASKGNLSRPKWKHLDAAFSGMRAVDITTDRVTAYDAARLAAGAARATVNQELAALRAAFRAALRAGRVASMPWIETPNPHNERQWFVTERQIVAVARVLPDCMRGVWLFASITGWRGKSDVLPLKWADVDWAHSVVRIVSRKSRRPIEFPFARHAPLRTLLLAQKAMARGPFVFHDDDGAQIKYDRYNDARKRACLAASVDPEKAKTHDLRRSASMAATRAGVPMKQVMDLMGHKTVAMFVRYNIPDVAALEEASAKLGAAAAAPRTVDLLAEAAGGE